MNRASNNATLHFYTTPPHACSYLPGRQAVTLFADPSVAKDTAVYTLLSSHGFRRSGEHLYRPHCHTCRQCVPVRVPVAEFVPRRHQRRTLSHNADLTVTSALAVFDPEQYALYRRYLASRHPGGGMDDPSPQQYLDFLSSSWTQTEFLEMRLGGRLVAVAVIDAMADALSAVYTFYEPDMADRGLGKFSILYEIGEASRRGLPWLYLGYWIRDCRKMSYKNDYQPIEYFWDGRWTRQPPTL